MDRTSPSPRHGTMIDARSLPPGLDPLPFGNGSATAFDDVASCTAFLERLPERPSLFDAVGPQTRFHVRLRTVPLPTLAIIAGSSTPKVVDHESRRAALVIPFGRCGAVIRIGRDEHRWASPHHAFFIPAGAPAMAESTAGSFLRIDVDEAALTAVASGMNDGAATQSIDSRSARIVPMKAAGMSWLPQIRAICSSIDALSCDAGLIHGAGLDDVVIRSVAMMLRPDLSLPREADARTRRGFDLDPLLERLTASLGERITLSDMESWTGRTARSIQLAFQRRFGIGPMQWLRERRLDAIHARLSSAGESAAVRDIAQDCGIPRMATLLAEYARRFGEKPAETRRRRRG